MLPQPEQLLSQTMEPALMNSKEEEKKQKSAELKMEVEQKPEPLSTAIAPNASTVSQTQLPSSGRRLVARTNTRLKQQTAPSKGTDDTIDESRMTVQASMLGTIQEQVEDIEQIIEKPIVQKQMIIEERKDIGIQSDVHKVQLITEENNSQGTDQNLQNQSIEQNVDEFVGLMKNTADEVHIPNNRMTNRGGQIEINFDDIMKSPKIDIDKQEIQDIIETDIIESNIVEIDGNEQTEINFNEQQQVEDVEDAPFQDDEDDKVLQKSEKLLGVFDKISTRQANYNKREKRTLQSTFSEPEKAVEIPQQPQINNLTIEEPQLQKEQSSQSDLFEEKIQRNQNTRRYALQDKDIAIDKKKNDEVDDLLGQIDKLESGIQNLEEDSDEHSLGGFRFKNQRNAKKQTEVEEDFKQHDFQTQGRDNEQEDDGYSMGRIQRSRAIFDFEDMQMEAGETLINKHQSNDHKQMSVDKKQVAFALNTDSSNDNRSSQESSGNKNFKKLKLRQNSSSEDEIQTKNKLSNQPISKRQGIDYASLMKGSISDTKGYRMTLRDLELSLPVENSDLDSDEDPDNYLDQLIEEQQRIKDAYQVLTNQVEREEVSVVTEQEKGPISEPVLEFDDSDNPYIQNKRSSSDQQKKKQNTVSKTTGRRANKRSQKAKNGRDLIDVIQEMENESDNSSQDSDNPLSDDEDPEDAAKRYYGTMYEDVLSFPAVKAPELQNSILSNTQESQGPTQYIDVASTKRVMLADRFKLNHYQDLMSTVDWNERKYQEIAKQLLKKNSVLLQNASQNSHKVKTRIVSNFYNLSTITAQLIKQRELTQARSTCLGLSDKLVFIGNSEGMVYMFDRENEKHHGTFTEKSKEFLGNAVTAIDIHPLKPEYIVLGFEKGQIVLMDSINSPQKSMKVVKDHHKPGVPIINIKFCDWNGPQGKYFGIVGQKKDAQQKTEQEDKSNISWMIMSIDAEGYVVITTIIKIVIVYKVTKYILVDPLTSYHHTFQSMSSRFSSPVYEKGLFDNNSIVAIGSRDTVLIVDAQQAAHKELIKISKPEKFYNKKTQFYERFHPVSVPQLSWGFGMSPVLKDRPHSILAIGWGPVIQLAVLIDHEQTDQPFILDGYYIVHTLDLNNLQAQQSLSMEMLISKPQEEYKSITVIDEQTESVDEKHKNEDIFEAFIHPLMYSIEALYFLSDSTLMMLLSGQEIRILDTQSFIPEQYDAERLYEGRVTIKKPIDALQQHPSELQSEIRCAQVLKADNLGFSKEVFPLYIQTLRFIQGKMVLMTTKGLQACNHLTWQQSIFDFQKIQKIRVTTALGSDDAEQEEDDLASVFLRALEIYKGRVKGYQGLVDNATLRENFLRAELKLLVKEIIQQVIDDAVSFAQLNSRSTVDMSKSELEKEKKLTKIVRIAIEFCVELKDCDFLFQDLCWLFQDNGGRDLELIFVRELEPYILSGRFQEWQLPTEVIDSFISRYYMDTQTSIGGPDVFEKVIVNLNLSQCSKQTIMNFIRHAEQHFLTTCVLFLYTQLFERKDNASCVQVLFSLYDLYKRSLELQGSSQYSLLDLHMLQQQSQHNEEKVHLIEKSSLYLGYKLFWVIRLFIYGKKFPQGNIHETKWRAYVHDIVSFLSSPQIIKDLMLIDAETLFQVVTVLFMRNSKPYELILMGRDDYISNDPSYKATKFQTHQDFLKDLDEGIFGELKGKDQVKLSEHAVQQYLFFIANIVAKDRDIQMSNTFYVKVTKELLKYHESYLDFNQNLQEMSLNGKPKDDSRKTEAMALIKKISFSMQRPLDQHSKALLKKDTEVAANLAAEEMKYIWKTESDFLNLLRKCEPMSTDDINELLELAEQTSFEQVRLYLLEKQEQYIRCLQMLVQEFEKKRSLLELETSTASPDLSNPHLSLYAKQFQNSDQLPISTQLLLMSEIGAQAERKGDRTIRWLSEKIGVLEARVQENPNNLTAVQAWKALKNEALANIKSLMAMSSAETIRLIDERFEGQHYQILQTDALRKDLKAQLQYLDTLLEENEQIIIEIIREYGIDGQQSKTAQDAKMYIDLIKMRLKLCCQLTPKLVYATVEKMVKGSKSGAFYPIEDCLQICQDFKQLDACFLLNKKLGRYYEAVNQGLELLIHRVDLNKLKIELYFAKTHRYSTNYPVSNLQLQECAFFDSVYRRVFNILEKHSKEVDNGKEEKVWYLVIDAMLDLKQNDSIILKKYCKKFFQQRINVLVEAMSRNVPFRKFLEHAIGRYQETQFKEFQEIILQIVFNQKSDENVLVNANTANSKVNSILFEQFSKSTRFGVLFRSRKCQKCKKYLDKNDPDMDLENSDEQENIFTDSDYDDASDDPLTQDNLKVFACEHAYHLPCLRKHYKKKLSLPELENIFSKQGAAKLRCPTCNISNFDVGNEKTQAAKRNQLQQQKQFNRMGSSTQDSFQDDMAHYREVERKRATFRETMLQNSELRKLDKLRKKVEHFENYTLESEGLKLGDFKKVQKPKKSIPQAAKLQQNKVIDYVEPQESKVQVVSALNTVSKEKPRGIKGVFKR